MLSTVQADITRLKVDAIVNAANESLLGGGGVDGAIHRVAGHELIEYCRGIGGCPTGEARITPGFKLPVKWIIHTVGPVWHGGRRGEETLLGLCYENSLSLAHEHKVQTLAFPGISTGVYAFPKDQAARIAITSCRKWEKQFDEIIFCCFSLEDKERYDSLLLPIS